MRKVDESGRLVCDRENANESQKALRCKRGARTFVHGTRRGKIHKSPICFLVKST